MSSPCVLYPFSSTKEHSFHLGHYTAYTAKYLEIFSSFPLKIEVIRKTRIPNVRRNERDNLVDLAVDAFIILGQCWKIYDLKLLIQYMVWGEVHCNMNEL
jgi:hypothetical protein